MKSTGSLIKGTLMPEFYDSFADYFVKFIRAYGSQGLPIYAITLQNEPNFEPEDYPGMRLEAVQRARVIGRHVGPRLERAGIRTLIWDWDHNWDVPESPMEVLSRLRGARDTCRVSRGTATAAMSRRRAIPHSAYPDKECSSPSARAAIGRRSSRTTSSSTSERW